MLAYLSLQARFFSRWLLPAYPVLVLLAGVAIAQAAEAVRSLRPQSRWVGAAALAGLVVVAVAQGALADVRSMRVLGREDTRQIAREWLVDHYPSSLRVVIEPAVPARYYRRQGRGGLHGLKAFVRGFAKHQAETRVQYPSLLKPDYIRAYRGAGFCLVMTMSVIEGRAQVAKLPQALAYYRDLRRESDAVYHVSPYKPGARPVRFDFDFSYNYYPSAFARPGPEITIYRLRNCKQKFGRLKKNEPLPGGIS
jgi:hypothetical protein